MKKMLMIGCIFLVAGVPVHVDAGKWSNFVTVSTEGNVVVSYRQRMQKMDGLSNGRWKIIVLTGLNRSQSLGHMIARMRVGPY